MRNRITSLRAERAWTQADLAMRAGVSRQTINAIETGKFDPSLPLPSASPGCSTCGSKTSSSTTRNADESWLHQPGGGASRSAMRANFSSSPRKLPSYEPREKIHDEIAEIRPTVSNVCVMRVPSASGSNVALDRPRRIQLPNLVANSRGRSTSRTSVGLFTGPKWTM